MGGVGFEVTGNLTFQEGGIDIDKLMITHEESIEFIKVWILLGYVIYLDIHVIYFEYPCNILGYPSNILGYPCNILGYPSKYCNYTSKKKLGWFPHSPCPPLPSG